MPKSFRFTLLVQVDFFYHANDEEDCPPDMKGGLTNRFFAGARVSISSICAGLSRVVAGATELSISVAWLTEEHFGTTATPCLKFHCNKTCNAPRPAVGGCRRRHLGGAVRGWGKGKGIGFTCAGERPLSCATRRTTSCCRSSARP